MVFGKTGLSMHFTGHYTYSVWIITVGHCIFAARECLISNQNNNWSAIQPAKEIRSGYNHAVCGCAFLAYHLTVFTSSAIASKFKATDSSRTCRTYWYCFISYKMSKINSYYWSIIFKEYWSLFNYCVNGRKKKCPCQDWTIVVKAMKI